MKSSIALLLILVCFSFLLGQSIQAIRPSYDLSFIGDSLPLPDGGVLISWRSSITEDLDIYAQRFSAEGLPLWDTPCALVVKAGAQSVSTILLSSGGNYIFTWSENTGVWAQLVNPQGQKLWGDEGILISEQSCWLAPNQNGGLFIVTNESNQPNSIYQLKGRSIDAAHNQLWTPQERTLLTSNMPLYSPNLLPEANGFIVNVAKELDNNVLQSCLLRYNSLGNQIGDEPLLSPEDFPVSVYKMLSLPGNQYLLWQNSNTNPDTLTLQKIDNQGNLLLPSAQVLLLPSSAGTTTTLYTHDYFTPLDDGGVLIAWSYDATIIQYQYRLQRLDSDLQPLWDTSGVSVTPANRNHSFNITVDSNQQIYCTWTEVLPDYIPRVKAQKLSPAGEFLWSAGGITLDENHPNVNSPIGWCGNNQFHSLWYAEQDSEYRLKRQTLSSSGIAQLPQGGLAFYSQLGGYCSKPLTINLDDSFFTFWQDVRPDNSGIYFQICDAQLNPALTQYGKRLLTSSAVTPALLQVEKSGEQIAVLYCFYGSSSSSYYLQLINASGEVLLPEFGYYLGQNISNIVLDCMGSDVYLAWVQVAVGSSPSLLKAQKFVSGVPVWEDGGKLIVSTPNSIGAMKHKNRYFCWQEYHSSITHSYARRVDTNGYIVTSWGNDPLPIIEDSVGSDYCKAIGLDGEDLIVYVSKYLSTGYELYAQKISPSGERLWGAGGIFMDSNSGNVLVASTLYGDGSAVCYKTTLPAVEIHLQKLDTEGNKLFGAGGASFSQTGTTTYNPLIYQNQNGWYSLLINVNANTGTDYDLYYRMISPLGEPSSPGNQLFCGEQLDQRNLSICGSGNRTFLAWEDLRAGRSNTNYTGTAIYAGVLLSQGSDVQEHIVPQAELSRVQSYPNPFTANATISFSMQTKGRAALDIYNLKGQKLQSLGCSATCNSGENQLTWDGRDSKGKLQPAGVYLYKLSSGNTVKTGKLLKL